MADSDKTTNERLHAVETSQAVHSLRINNVETLITDHVKECRETRKELRMWLMGIVGTILGAAIIFWLKLAN